MTTDHGFKLPLTQTELGDTLGLTPVHVNRILKEFRQQGLIAVEHRRLSLLDMSGLQEMADFNQDYLNLGGASKEVTQYFDNLESGRAAPQHS